MTTTTPRCAAQGRRRGAYVRPEALPGMRRARHPQGPRATQRRAWTRPAGTARKEGSGMTTTSTSTTELLTEEQRGVLGRALADAISYREPSGDCSGCPPGGALCDPHRDDLGR